MKVKILLAACCCMLLSQPVFCQSSKKTLTILKTKSAIKVDGVPDESAWKESKPADQFIALKPVPFQPESAENATRIYFLYNEEGIYVGGYLQEKSKDSIASELIGRDGFGNNDFLGVIFDTYNDKINGFEYFVTPLGEQMDAKTTTGNEDFSWNAVWESASKIHPDGWSFEMFIPFSAIRFGKKTMQEWGLNIVRRRQKSGQQLFWQAIDPNINGFLTQEGLLKGLEDIKPPLRLQFSPYLSLYQNHDDNSPAGKSKNNSSVNGGMDIKYGINQAFTLDMTLIPDFGQVQTDNQFLNLSPFEARFTENRPFFTEGTELFNKGNLFYSRRIGVDPLYLKRPVVTGNDTLLEVPTQAKIINASKISGRTQKGLGIGVLNAITQTQYATLQRSGSGETYQEECMPLTNYNVLVLDQTLKHNSSVSFVNTNVWRSGKDYDANVSSALFDLNDRKNNWNVGGNVSISNIKSSGEKPITGYAHSVYFGKTSGRFNFNIYQDLFDKKYDKSDLGYFTNNNSMDQGIWMGYKWNNPTKWFNQARLNLNGWFSRLVSPIDNLKRKEMMFQNLGANINGNAQLKKLQWIGFNLNKNAAYNDFYEPRSYGRVFRNKGSVGLNLWYESNGAKKYSWTANIFTGTGGVFKRKSFDYSLTGKARFNKKFSVDYTVSISTVTNQIGWAASQFIGGNQVIYFSRRDVKNVENILNIKYNFTNRMGITFRTRHAWTKVQPQQLYELDAFGDLQTPASPYTGNVNQNYNFLSADMVYTWQFAQGSFINVVWKDIGGSFTNSFEKSYIKNLSRTMEGPQFTSLSLRIIYFLDYITAKKNLSHRKA